jgi:hypothetical protein
MFVEFSLHLIELLTDPYYNKFAVETIGEIGCKELEARAKSKKYYGGKKNEKPKGKSQH